MACWQLSMVVASSERSSDRNLGVSWRIIFGTNLPEACNGSLYTAWKHMRTVRCSIKGAFAALSLSVLLSCWTRLLLMNLEHFDSSCAVLLSPPSRLANLFTRLMNSSLGYCDMHKYLNLHG
ncbi:hypothetical protein K450DRAFT_234301 [Umbelopsis ramanniana AG]|uniref:Uncharacterized protein n=1 Tax=Umbelopsis ramanniana AG TaxID=1314678 RepID=A0AAD5EBT8_UMBRA|nr:uncharacterized protein K450DRAFT_234301 [Umbelopsis ramanniana AG]KAI8581031.1 hypothetical protein K450DRAFT_234301 [Umbelopsis ramanniana AG]